MDRSDIDTNRDPNSGQLCELDVVIEKRSYDGIAVVDEVQKKHHHVVCRYVRRENEDETVALKFVDRETEVIGLEGQVVPDSIYEQTVFVERVRPLKVFENDT